MTLNDGGKSSIMLAVRYKALCLKMVKSSLLFEACCQPGSLPVFSGAQGYFWLHKMDNSIIILV
jgi:hypothetical protein